MNISRKRHKKRSLRKGPKVEMRNTEWQNETTNARLNNNYNRGTALVWSVEQLLGTRWVERTRKKLTYMAMFTFSTQDSKNCYEEKSKRDLLMKYSTKLEIDKRQRTTTLWLEWWKVITVYYTDTHINQSIQPQQIMKKRRPCLKWVANISILRKFK